MHSTTKQLAAIKIIPMIKDITLREIDEVLHALILGGIEALNISQQSADGLEILRYLNNQYPNILSGGGNVQTIGEARNAIEAGAKFIFSPLFDPVMVDLCHDNGIPIYPVITDGVIAVEASLHTVGLYPIEKLGGLDIVEKLYDQFGLTSIVAGAINDETSQMYLSHKGVLAVTGSWMIDKEHLETRSYDKIILACQKALLFSDD